MNRKFYTVLSIVILIGIQPIFAQQSDSAGTTTGEKSRTERIIDMELASDKEFKEALEASSDIEIINKNSAPLSDKKPAAAPAEKSAVKKPAATKKPVKNTEKTTSGSISDNEYLQEGQRLANLAEDAYNEGDYDTSADLAESAIQYAELSDEYVAEQTGVVAEEVEEDGPSPLPASYTVRAWGVSQDCFWNIAGRPWVYGNPRQWRVLYNANKAKLPDPNNPNVIEPGTVLDIPSLKGEVRQGDWDANKSYKPLP
jgi:nucleoid-associated protein YgaU